MPDPFFSLLLPFQPCCKEGKVRLVFIISARDTIVAAKAFRELSSHPGISENCRLEFFTDRELREERIPKDDIHPGDIILADFMKRETDSFLSTILEKGRNDIYSLRCGYLARELEKKGIVPDSRTEAYFQPPTVENLKNMVRMILSLRGMKTDYEEPFVLPDAGIFHPDADTLFKDFDVYLDWYKKKGKLKGNSFWVGIHTYRSSSIRESGKLEGHIVAALEKEGVNALPIFGRPPYHKSMQTYFLDEKGHPKVDAVFGFSFRFLRGFPEETKQILTRIDAPIFIPLEAHSITIDQWEKSDTGISTLRTAWQVCIPEQNGGIEPTLVGGKTPVRLKGMTDVLYDRVALPDQVDFLVKRIRAWHNLRIKPNQDKKIALLYWNHPPGKQNIGGSYMNCFRSMSVIIQKLIKQGYAIDGEGLTEDGVKKRILLGARNVGSWAPGELDRLIAEKSVIKISLSEYQSWFDDLPQAFKANVIEQWGAPETSDIMVRDGSIVIPRIDLGNLIVMPQPSRGFGEDPEKLYSETMIPYGNHTFGVSPDGEALGDLTLAMCETSPEIDKADMAAMLEARGKSELASLVKALGGGYIEAAKGNDPIRNPDAVPTGKNFYGFNIDKFPSREAWKMGQKLSDEMIAAYREKHDGAYPEKLGLILWSTELQRNEGASVAAVFYLLGITPVWDQKDQVVDIAPIPGSVLKRPRIDVLVQSSGLFRDSYARLIKLMDRAVNMASSLKDVENFIAVHNRKIETALLENGYSPDEAAALSRARVFAPMPGAYSHALQELIPNSGVWEDDKEIADVFIHHYSFAYGNGIWGKPLKSAYKSNLEDVKMTMHTRSSNLYNMLDNDDMFAFLGGLSLAVKSQTGEYPETVVANMQDGKTVSVEDLSRAIGKSLRTRYLNPKWIQGMKKDGYSGARSMDKFVEYLWGFQVTSPFAVNSRQWEEIHDVYIQDKYGQDLKAFFDEHNPWALQSISARMLEADRKGYWKAPEEMKKNLARTFAVSVIEKGVACCEHTCNNPMFQDYVTNFLSLAGLLTPEQMDRFKTALAKASGKTLEEQMADHHQARQNLEKIIEQIQKDEDARAKTRGENIEGFEMVEEKLDQTSVSSSGSAWQVMVIAGGILLLLFVGYKRVTIKY